jgi:FG-GAP-like repeat
VVWMRGTKTGKYEQLALDGWPRVVDVEAADFNADGTLDVAVAAFGWRKVGKVTVLENHTTDYAHPSFVPREIDPRPGAIHAIPGDLDKDGRMDLVVLFAQQFESVVAFLNKGGPAVEFTPQVIYTAPHPNWGSSGIQVVDLDLDGDLDVLMTHGDTFDDDIIKPYHGIQWLENRGTFPFVEHTLADLPGVSRAQAADLDGDGDLDVVASAFIAGAGGTLVDESGLAALVWLEQVKPGVFERRTLAMGKPRHANFDAGDFDQDGDIDLVVGNFMLEAKPKAWVEVWENQRITATGTTK